MPETIRDALGGRQFLVTIRGNGEVYAEPSDIVTPKDELSLAICAEIISALEDAIQGGYVGGYCVDAETGVVEQEACS